MALHQGYPCAKVTLASGLKLGYSITPVNFTSFADVFRHRDILCNGPKFKLILRFSMDNTLNSRKKGNGIIVDRKQLFIFQMFIIKLGNWMIQFKFAQLLVTHDGGKLTWVGELSLAEYLQGR